MRDNDAGKAADPYNDESAADAAAAALGDGYI